MGKKELSYADKRLAPLGVTAEKYTFTYQPYLIDHWNDQAQNFSKNAEAQYLKEDTKGDILIQYPSINNVGAIIVETQKNWHIYRRKRLADPAPQMPKYLADKGSTIEIFLPKNTLEKVREKKEIETLYIVEGEIKAIYGDWHGLDIIGISGIHLFIERKNSREFHNTIQQILHDCKVNNIVLLHDADIIEINFDFENTEKDYAQRLVSFFSSVRKFIDAVDFYNEHFYNISDNKEAFSGVKPYYMHIREGLPKGLDDLLTEEKDNIENIIEEIQGLKTRTSTFVKCYKLEGKSLPDIKRIFLLDTDANGKPQQFYNVYYREIGNEKFWFNSVQWKQDPNDMGTIIPIFHKELMEYIRVGTDYFREVLKIEPYQDENTLLEYRHKRSLMSWKKETIVQDFVRAKGLKNALNYIRKFKSFCAVPAHDKDYRRIIDDQYNLYHPLTHELKPGKWPNIEKFLRHLFDNNFQRVYDIALDILQLKYTKPLQKLPITVLFSKEKNTGKSTFLWLLNEIYQDNASIIGNKELEDNFDEYKTANVLLMDELIMEKQKHFETLKSWTTSPYSSMNRKSKERVKTVFYASIFMTTNHLQFVSMDTDENRFLVCKIPTINPEENDPNLLAKMSKEIPAFLYHLKNERKLVYNESSSRFWFPIHAYETPILDEVKNRGLKMVVKAIKEYIREMFFEYRIEYFEITPVLMAPHLRKYAHRHISNNEIINSLKDDFQLKEPKYKRYNLPRWQKTVGTEGQEIRELVWERTYTNEKGEVKDLVGMPYRFEAAKMLDAEEYKELKKEIKEFNSKPDTDETQF